MEYSKRWLSMKISYNRLRKIKNNYAIRSFRKQICLSSNLTDKNNILEDKIFLFME